MGRSGLGTGDTSRCESSISCPPVSSIGRCYTAQCDPEQSQRGGHRSLARCILMADTKPVFLFDVDNTLLDHDKVSADLKRHLQTEVGNEKAQRYWEIFEDIRSEIGYADYLGALQRYRIEHPRDPHLLQVSYFLLSYPFANRLFPGSIDAVKHVNQWG